MAHSEFKQSYVLKRHLNYRLFILDKDTPEKIGPKPCVDLDLNHFLVGAAGLHAGSSSFNPLPLAGLQFAQTPHKESHHCYTPYLLNVTLVHAKNTEVTRQSQVKLHPFTQDTGRFCSLLQVTGSLFEVCTVLHHLMGEGGLVFS